MKTLLILLALAANGTDAYYTNRNINNRGFMERDPIARPFTRNTAWCAASNGVNIGAVLYAAHKLRRHGQDRWADALLAADISGHTYGAAESAVHYGIKAKE